ncbi:MAG: tetratricopeptide repeat protein, partial [Longimicrobiales bacterium]
PAPVAFADFVGAETCAECHAKQYEAWRGSTHGRAGGDPTSALLVRDFDGRAIEFRDATVTPRRLDDGGYAFVVAQDGRAPDTLRIDGVVGGAHMAGGGTQGFFTRLADGTLRFLPFEIIREEGVWFCNTGTRLDRGWIPITANMRLADCGDWPPVRVMGDIPRFANCQQCHGSQIDVEPVAGKPYRTRLVSYTINCESCHGSGRRHVELVRSGETARSADIGMRPLATLDTDASLDVCFQCHALKDAIRPGYLPGASIDDYYSIALPLLSDEPVLPDGRIRTFAYQQGHLYSDCYLNGALTCTDCHDPHSQGYRDVDGNPLPGRFDDRQCTSCHASKAVQPERHTRHAARSEGSRCVACHMPYLQEPEVGRALRYARSDHTIPVPRPAADAALGVEVACARCHRDRDAATLQRDVDRLWGTLKPRPAIVEALLRYRADSAGSPASDLLRIDAGDHDMARFQALGHLLERLRPDAGLERANDERLRALAGYDNPDIAGAALAALHYAAGDDPSVRRFLTARLDSLGDAENAVRGRWAVLLGFLGDQRRTSGDPAAGIASYVKALEIRPNDPAILLNLGLAYAQAGDLPHAVEHYRRSIAIDPARSLAHVNLGIALAAMGDSQGAMRAYAAGLDVNPGEALAHFNLGNLHLRAGRTVEAVDAYTRAATADPSLAPAYFNLARAYIVLGRSAAAAEQLRRGLEFDPDDDGALRLLRQIEQPAGTRTR